LGALSKLGGHYKAKVEALTSFEQILVEKLGYEAASVGKWHVPSMLAYGKEEKGRRVVSYNDFGFEYNVPEFSRNFNWKVIYKKSKDFLLKRDKQAGFCKSYKKGQQENTFTDCPYSPIKLDSRFGKPTKTKLSEEAGFESFETGKSNMAGRDSLAPEYTPTGVLGAMGVQHLKRMIDNYYETSQPFSLSLHFNAPHPPSTLIIHVFDPSSGHLTSSTLSLTLFPISDCAKQIFRSLLEPAA